MSPTLYLYDDGAARSWDPFVLTRPVGELLFGAFLFRERAQRYWNCPCRGQITRPDLRGFSEAGSAPVVPPDAPAPDVHRVLQSSRAALSDSAPTLPTEPATLLLDGDVVGWSLPPGTPSPPEELLLDPEPLDGSRRVEVEGELLETPWELMARNGGRIQEDISTAFHGYAAESLPGCHILGDGLLSLGSRVLVEPGCVFDVREGPIRLSDNVVVRAHTRLQGPAWVGPGSTLLGGSLGEISVGPACKVRGEVEASVILGYSNKAHDGFLGHAYLGRWVNLGAFTTNSDLKNNYGPVRVGGASGPVDTGLLKVGCFLGDHVKTGIGTLLNTGSVVGAGSNLFGGEMPPTWVPPFSWGSGGRLTEFRLDKFLEVAERAMSRREVVLDDEMTHLLTRAWETTRSLRAGSTDG